MVVVDACPLCSEPHHVSVFAEDGYEVRRCRACGMVWVSPRLDERGLVEIYAQDSYWRSEAPRLRGYARYREDEQLYLATFRLRLSRALRHGPVRGRALDVGCAAGYCMRVLADRGFEVHGVEPSPAIAGYGRERFGFDTIHVGTLDTAPLARASFDLITMWDVVEHVPDPLSLLETARSLLRPGGTLVLETQNVTSPFARVLGSRWHHFKHAEHIYHFNPRTIEDLLGRAGFAVVDRTARFAGKYVAPDFIVERAGRVHPALSHILSPVSRLATRGFYVNVMDEMMVVARAAQGPR